MIFQLTWHLRLWRKQFGAGPYHGVQSDPKESLWRDPPGYWEDIVYPAYLDADDTHKDIFVDGDVERGPLTSTVGGLVLIESLEISMSDAGCSIIFKYNFQ
jgi:nicotinamide/nicotinate riboside kinase